MGGVKGRIETAEEKVNKLKREPQKLHKMKRGEKNKEINEMWYYFKRPRENREQ